MRPHLPTPLDPAVLPTNADFSPREGFYRVCSAPHRGCWATVGWWTPAARGAGEARLASDPSWRALTPPPRSAGRQRFAVNYGRDEPDGCTGVAWGQRADGYASELCGWSVTLIRLVVCLGLTTDPCRLASRLGAARYVCCRCVCWKGGGHGVRVGRRDVFAISARHAVGLTRVPQLFDRAMLRRRWRLRARQPRR